MKLAMIYNKDYAIALVYAWDAALRMLLLNGIVENDYRLYQEELRDFIRTYNGH